MNTKSHTNTETAGHKWLRRLILAVALMICVPIGLFTVSWFNRDTIIELLQDYYGEHYHGTLTIGAVDANFISAFPKLGFTITDIQHVGYDSVSDEKSSLIIKQAKIVVRARELLAGNILLRKIQIRDATISSEITPTRPFSYYTTLKAKQQKKHTDSLKLLEIFDQRNFKFLFENVRFISKDTTLNKHFDLTINRLDGQYKGKGKMIEGSTSLHAIVKKMGFNTDKGAFFKDSQIKGKTTFVFNWDQQWIDLREFPLSINDQPFDVKADFKTAGNVHYQFQIKNDSTNFQLVKELLSDSVSVKLKKYDIQNTFDSSLNLSGSFQYGNNPKIEASFSSIDNNVVFQDTYVLENATFNGRLTNQIHPADSLLPTKSSKKDVRIELDHFLADLDGLHIAIDESYFQSTPDAMNFVDANIFLEGTNEALAKLIDTENFDFNGGDFRLEAKIHGDIPSSSELARNTTGNFRLDNTRVVLRRNGLQLPIGTIDIDLQKNMAQLRGLDVLLPNDRTLTLNGYLENPLGLLSKDSISNTSSRIDLISDNLNINEIIEVATEFIPKKNSRSQDLKNLHESMDAIYRQFRPQFNIDLKNLEYDGIKLHDIKGNLELMTSETIAIKKFEFNYLDALTSLQGTVTVPTPNGESKDPIHLDIDAVSLGPVRVFENLFNIQVLEIISGTYKLEGNVSGNVNRFEELMQRTTGKLHLRNNLYYYEPTDVDIAIDSLKIGIENSNMVLDKFRLDIGDLYPVSLNGRVKRFSHFLLDSGNGPGSIDLNIEIPYLDGNKLTAMISSTERETRAIKPDKKDLHSVFKDLNKFDPAVVLTIDSLKYRELITKDLRAFLKFENDSTLNLEKFKVDYKHSEAEIVGQIIAHEKSKKNEEVGSFKFDFGVLAHGESKDLNDYLQTTNFIFDSGNFEFIGGYKGESENLTLIHSNATGRLQLGPSVINNEAAGLQIPIDSLDVEIDDNIATLKTLDIELPGKSSLDFSGSINDFSAFVENRVLGNRQGSDFRIHADYLDTKDLTYFFNSSNTLAQEEEENSIGSRPNLGGLKDALVGINTSFNPRLHIIFDTLKHKNVTLKEFKTNLFYTNSGDFEIDGAELNFYGGKAKFNIGFGLSEEHKLPIEIDMFAENINLFELVSRLDYLNDNELKLAEKIGGLLNLQLKAHGWLDDEGHIDNNSLNGTLELDLREMELFGYQPIMESVPFMKNERFEHLRFRPIVQTFEVKNGEIIIPQTEIQSTALQAFVEGRIKLDQVVNIWISLPWKNLKTNDGVNLPEKTGYKNAGSKFHIQLLQDRNHAKPKKRDLKIKLRLSKRQYRKHK